IIILAGIWKLLSSNFLTPRALWISLVILIKSSQQSLFISLNIGKLGGGSG
ncbi:MAG: hypothetical protein H2674_22620, partial [Limnospira indica BM01]